MRISEKTMGVLAFQMFSLHISRLAEEDLLIPVKAHDGAMERPGLLFFKSRFVLAPVSTISYGNELT